jgi:hypothetical protein
MGVTANIDNLLRFDKIRLFKLLEISYYAIISLMLTATITSVLVDDDLNPHFFKSYDYENTNIVQLFMDILIDLVALVIYLYYLHKILKCIPFIFNELNKNYVPSMKGENIVGIGLGSAIILYPFLKHPLSDKVESLISKIKNKDK